MLWNFILILILVALNGFFVATEFAVITSRKSRIKLQAEEGNGAAKLVLNWLENPQGRDKLIAAAQLGITIVSLALGAVGENTFEVLLEPVFHSLEIPLQWSRIEPLLTALPLVFSLIIVTSLHVVLGEQVPKVAALESPEQVALFVATPMRWFSAIFTWFVDLLDWATQTILGLLGVTSSGGSHSIIYTVDELKQILIESEEGGTIGSPEREMLDAIFDFNRQLVRQVMKPRTEIIALSAETALKESIQVAIQTRFSKFPVYEGDLDNIIGVVHIKDLLRAQQEEGSGSPTAGALVREPLLVPESSTVRALMGHFRAHSRHIAIVLDEYGGTAGLITLEDALEEIVGEISDPFDEETPEIQRINQNTVMVDGLAAIEDVNQTLGTNFNDPNYDTIAGYLLGYLDHIPVQGETIVLSGGIQLQVVAMDGLRISKIQIQGV
ncbi:MAG: hemolysin family protein [Anaerolineales bacterium]|nr:hemolysin family protein [Anaerolineales bacterium]